MICPECMGTLAVATPVLAKCTTHGGVYRVLFQRGPGSVAAAPRAAAAVAPAAAPSSAGGVTCVRHPAVEATLACARCSNGVCDTCAFPRPDGSIHCPDCASGRMLGILDRPAPQTSAPCARHPEVSTGQQCSNCHAAICETCDFRFEGNLHFCPSCATASSSSEGPSRKRKLLAVAGYGLALWCTLAVPALIVASAAFSESKDAEALIGLAWGALLLLPSFAGLAVSFSAFERRRANPWWFWGGAVWNGLIFGLLLLAMIVGTLKG